MINRDLSDSQLTDVLNYVLGLPRRDLRGKITQHAIPVFMTRIWGVKALARIEHICDAKLSEAGIIPAKKSYRNAGRRGAWPLHLSHFLEVKGIRI